MGSSNNHDSQNRTPAFTNANEAAGSVVTYTAAQTEPLAQRLVANLPGLDINLARSWITAESGGNNNPLGVTASAGSGQPVGQWIGGKTYLVKYPTPQAGIDAATALLQSPSMSWAYGGVGTAIKSGDRTAQAKALIASPWNATNSPYYTRVFTRAGFLGGTGSTAFGGHTPEPTTTATNPTLTTDQWNTVISSLTPGTRYISATNAPDIIAAAGKQGLTLTTNDLTPFYGKSVSNLRDSLAAKGTIPKADITGGVLDGLTFWLNPVRVLYVVGGLLMIVAGGWIMVRNTGLPGNTL